MTNLCYNYNIINTHISDRVETAVLAPCRVTNWLADTARYFYYKACESAALVVILLTSHGGGIPVQFVPEGFFL